MIWNEGAIARLSELWKLGQTGGQIAKTMGTTRNSVMGKISRLGLCRDPSRPKPTPQKRIRKRMPVLKVLKWGNGHVIRYSSKQELDAATEQAGKSAVTFEQLNIQHCRWPLSGDGLEILYCGDERLTGHSYCWRHCLRSYNLNRCVGYPTPSPPHNAEPVSATPLTGSSIPEAAA